MIFPLPYALKQLNISSLHLNQTQSRVIFQSSQMFYLWIIIFVPTIVYNFIRNIFYHRDQPDFFIITFFISLLWWNNLHDPIAYHPQFDAKIIQLHQSYIFHE